jgi:hypothetical protein
MSKLLKGAFLLQAVLAVLTGLPLLLAPGRFLGIFGWAPVEPLLDRLLGAALLAMAWTSIFAFRASNRSQVNILVQMQLIFCGLGALGFLRHLTTGAYYPPMVWTVFAVLATFTIVWAVGLFQMRAT